jgi:hypothetical protein
VLLKDWFDIYVKDADMREEITQEEAVGAGAPPGIA